MANEFLFEQTCPNCGQPLLMHGHNKGTGCYGPTIEQMHAQLKINLERAIISDEVP